MISTRFSTAFFLMGLSVAFANAPLPTSYLGLDYLAMASSNLYEGSGAGCFSGGCGGEFNGTLSTVIGSTVIPDGVQANFWCVDAQEDFNYGTQGYADVVQLSQAGSFPDDVRYSGVTNSGPPTWTDTSLSPSAIVRYEMAAWLVSQYPGGVGTSPDNPVITGGAQSDAIQEAIWTIMNNNSPGLQAPYPAGDEASPSLVSSYITQAAASFSTVNADDWAVVSWAADPNSNPAGALVAGQNYQTFLVNLAGGSSSNNNENGLTPEPGFYGVLTVGLGGLLLAIRRRKTA
jgi:hypothetical protein